MPRREYFPYLTVVPIADALARYFGAVTPPAVREALQSVLNAAGALTAVVEHGYFDIDHTAAYHLQMGRAFTRVERTTTRVHFFSHVFQKPQFYAPTRRVARLLANSYLGYSVIRPGPPPTLGRTFLRPPRSVGGILALFPTRIEIQANLCGLPLRVEACPFLSQDQQVSACGTASVWMASTPLVQKVRGLAEYTTADITLLAKALDRPFTPALGKRGLTSDEIQRALAAMKYDPVTFDDLSADDLRQSCYMHIESGLPILLFLHGPRRSLGNAAGSLEGSHVVTVIGYAQDTTYLQPAPSASPAVYPSTAFASCLVVHDDQRGMYLPATIEPVTPQEKRRGWRAVLKIVQPSGRSIESYCDSLIVPFPPRVMMPVYDVFEQVEHAIQDFQSRGHLFQQDIVLRPFLIRSNRYKECLSQRSGMPRTLQTLYRGLPMPLYIWVCEYGYTAEWQRASLAHLPIHGEFLFDATSAIAMSNTAGIAVHLPGGVAIREGMGTAQEALPVHRLPTPPGGYQAFPLELSRP